MTAAVALCPFCGHERRRRTRPGPWLFERHPTAPGHGVGFICRGSGALLPVPNVWTSLVWLYQYKENPAVDITIYRHARVAHLAPGDVIAHPDGEPFQLDEIRQMLLQRVKLVGRYPARPSRRHHLEAETGDEVQVFPTDDQARQVWETIADAVGMAVAYYEGQQLPDAVGGNARDVVERMSPPWGVGATDGHLEIKAAGHSWHVYLPATEFDAGPVAEPTPEPAAAEG